MENKAGFDLNSALAQWSEQAVQNGQLTAEQARELEIHLCESCADLIRRGVTGEEAFWLARRRLGSRDCLAEEFDKVNPSSRWVERLVWLIGGMLVTYLGAAAISFFSTILTQLQRRWQIRADGGSYWVIWLFSFALVLGPGLAVIILGARHWNRVLGVIRSPIRPAFGCGLVLGAVALGFGIAWWDSRLVNATPADGLGSMLYAGWAIGHVTAALTSALFILVLSLTIALLQWRAARRAAPH